ncbi:MAG TPA: hypothetical protein DF614_05940, partial [Methylococcaceae bacterium]|nr:hypothetical protein [Methylococcaceae bacterium]
ILDDDDSALTVFAYQNTWWVASPRRREIRHVDNTGRLLKKIDVSTVTPSAHASEPVAVAVSDDKLFWADRANHRICQYDLARDKALACFGQRGEREGEFQYPFQMAFDRDGYLYVVDILNARIQQFDQHGRFFGVIGTFGLKSATLFRPNGIAFDTNNDLLYVSDSYFGTIKVFHAGEPLGQLVDAAGKTLILQSPTSLAWHENRLVVAETLGNQVVELSINTNNVTPAMPNKENEDVKASQKNCLLCHLSWNSKTANKDAQGMLPDGSFLMCYSCHNGAIVDSRRRIGTGQQHTSVYDSAELKKARFVAHRQDKVPEDFPHGEHDTLNCASPHTPHTKAPATQKSDTLYKDHANAWLRVPNQNGDLCEKCHESKGKAARDQNARHRGVNHPLGIKLSAPRQLNANGFALEPALQAHGLPQDLIEHGAMVGHQNEMVCQTCHQIHGGEQSAALTVLDNSKAALCIRCHARQFSENEHAAHKKGVHPVNIKPDSKKHLTPMKKDGKTVDFVTCNTCHVTHNGQLGSALLDKKYANQEALCETCHDKQSAKNKEDARRKGIHPVNVKPDSPMKQHDKDVTLVTCQSCHNVHSGNPDTALLDKGIKEAEALCQTCHTRQHAKDKDDAKQKGVHPLNVTLDKAVEIVVGKTTRKVGCLTCHSVHEGKPNTAALVETDKDGQLCSHCHQGKQAVVGSNHDLRLSAKNSTNRFGEKPASIGVCGNCHSLHRAESHTPQLSSATRVIEDFSDDTLQHSHLREDKLCLNCHQKQGIAKETRVKYFTHPRQDMVLRSDKTSMPLLNSKEDIDDIGEIACKTCHEPHFWSAKIHAKALASAPTAVLSLGQSERIEGGALDSFLRTEGVKNTFCVACHGVNALPKFKYFHDKDKVRQLGAAYIK